MMQNNINSPELTAAMRPVPVKEQRNCIPVFGITGGVGSGKSVVMRMLKQEFHGAVILADQVGHDLMKPGAVSYQKILRQFGTGILDENCRIDRQALSAIVFSDAEKLRELNQITHPNIRMEIIRQVNAFRREKKAPFIALEAALLIEGGYEDIADKLWYVYVSEENRIKRLMEGRGYTEEKSRSIMSRQLSEEVFRRHCQIIIDNNGPIDETRKYVKEALKKCGVIS